MIANHHTLNIAHKGLHYARVKFPDLEPERIVKTKAKLIAMAISDSLGGSAKDWSFTLTAVECSGHDVEF